VPPAPSALSERLQAALGKQYVIERELGRGGMGVVFLASDLTLHRRVAVKVVQPELADHGTIAQRFLTEARTVARLRHPNIVAIHAAAEGGGLLYYVMDYVAGESLRERLSREERLPVEDACCIIKDIAAALNTAAAAGVVHRDIKPANVLLDAASGRAMLVDFGIARICGADGGAVITGDGLVLGTPTYMSPEQASGEEIDARSDLYALGVMGYEMLAGRPPFEGSYRLVVSQHLSTNPTPIRRMRRDCPPNLAHVVMRALEKPPADRWQNGAEMRDAVDEPPRPATHRWRWLQAAAAAAVLVSVLTFGLTRPDPNRIPAGVNPRHSMLLLPFDNLRNEPSSEWLQEGSLSMLVLDLSQWDDLAVVDHGRVHDLLDQNGLAPGDPIGLTQARQLAREAGVWTVVLGEFDQAGDSLHLTARVFDVATGERIDLASASGVPGTDVRPLFDELASSILNLSGAPDDITTDLARATTGSVEAYRAYLSGVDHLNRWELADAIHDLKQATQIDTTFGLAYYYLALSRGWIYGGNDAESNRAVASAGRYSTNLPLTYRTLIRAYRAFVEGNLAIARQYYQELIERDGNNAAAWYGLGDSWFHDDGVAEPERFTHALRAFKRTGELDPGFTLALEHVDFMLHEAGRAYPRFALMPADSFVATRSPDGRLSMDSVALTVAVDRARKASLDLARNWVAAQPNGMRAQYALIDAYVNDGQYRAAHAEADQIAEDGDLHPELPFARARIFFAAGEPELAGETLRGALDSVTPDDFSDLDPDFNLVASVEATANVFAYQGDLGRAAQAIQFADQVRTALELRPATHSTEVDPLQWQRWRLSHLYSAAGASVAIQRRVWDGAAEAARRADPDDRPYVAHSGAAAALGIFLQSNDTTALTELRALTGEDFSREVRAWLAVNEEDPTAARSILEQTDPAKKTAWYRKPMEAEVYFELGDYGKTVSLLEEFEPDHFRTDYFDVRWGMLGRVRMLRAMAYEELGRTEDAQREYRQVVAQWQSATEDPFDALRSRAQQRLAWLSSPAG
jgi:serine/threonine-protein kinase